MKKINSAFLLLLSTNALARENALEFEPNTEHPFGRPNPAAPKELSQFAFMIGNNNCTEKRRTPGSDNWVESKRTWDAHYALNGMAIMDSGRSGNSTNGNIRAFDTATGLWHVTFFSMPIYGSGVWKGKVEDGKIVLKQPQKAPGTDFDGISKLTFSNISNQGFNWNAEWISEDGSVVYSFWEIRCKKSTDEQKK